MPRFMRSSNSRRLGTPSVGSAGNGSEIHFSSILELTVIKWSERLSSPPRAGGGPAALPTLGSQAMVPTDWGDFAT